MRIKMFVVMAVSLFALGLVACAPPQLERYEEIETNETAFVVPLEGASKGEQGKFMSVDYLAESKAATKRISIPTRWRSTGRSGISGEWVPTVRIIRVNRTPVTREWTAERTTGTSEKNEAVYVESLDSIGFGVGVNVTALVSEENAAKFLYYYAGLPLEQVIDKNVRSLVQTTLGREFGTRDLAHCKSDKAAIFTTLVGEIRDELASRGITIVNLGHSEGLRYEDKEIQASINRAYIAEMDIKTAGQEKLAQVERNALMVAKAEAERKVAEEFAKAQEAQVAKIELDIARVRAEATLEAARRWNGVAPASIVPSGSGFLFGLDAQK